MWSRLRQFFKNKDNRPFIIKTFFYFILFSVTFYGAYGMAKSFITVRGQKVSKQKELKDIQARLDVINSESVRNDEFQKEKIVREKLHMTRPGEDIIIIVPPDKE